MCIRDSLLKDHLHDWDHLVASAAKIGGISYFHEYAYDLMAENERIMASTFDAAIHAFQNNKLKKLLFFRLQWFMKTPISIQHQRAIN